MKTNNNQNTSFFKVSASSLKTYKQCPKKYMFTYIEQHAKKQWDHFDVGNLCHKALELFYNKYINVYNLNIDYVKEIDNCFDKAKELLKINKKQVIDDAYNIIQKYCHTLKPPFSFTLGTEIDFDIIIEDQIHLRGVVDRLDLLDDKTYHIVDYKTTKNIKFLDNFQLLAYGLWLQHKYPNIQKYKASYVLLRHNSVYKSYYFTIKDIEQCKKKILEDICVIKKDTVWETKPSRLCNFCDFFSICPSINDRSW